MFYKGRNVLVAGGAGLVGQSLVRQLLDQGASVRATQYRSRKIAVEHKNLEIVSCDLASEEDARRVFQDMDIVFLAAAKVRGAKQMNEDPTALILYNLMLHARLMQLAAQKGLERCAYLSSSYVYPDTGRPSVESEGFQGDPCGKLDSRPGMLPMSIANFYGLGWVQRYLETVSRHFQMTSKTGYAIVRPTAYYGPHDNFNLEECHVIPALIAKAVNRMDPYEVWGDGSDVRAFTYVDDLVEGLMLVTEKHAQSDPVNICAREAHSVKDALSMILEILDFHPMVVFDKSKPSTMPYKVSDPSKACKLLGWEAKTSLKNGLRRTIDWYVRQKGSSHLSLPASRLQK